MDVRSIFANQGYSQASKEAAVSGGPIDALGSVAKDFEATLREAETVSKASLTEKTDPHTLVQALTQAELAVETAVTIRNKVVEAYGEILRMPI